MKRGQLWWVDLGEPRGSVPAFRRPVLLVQDDLLNESKLATVMVAPLTTHVGRGKAAGNVLLEPRESGLSKPSVVLVCQVMTVDKALLVDLIRAIPKSAMRKVDLGLALVLGLPRFSY